MCGEAAGHMSISRRQTAVETAPVLAAIVAAQNLRVSPARLLGSIAAKADRVIGSCANGAVSFPRCGPIFSRPEKDSIWCTGMDHCRDGIGAPHSTLRFRPKSPVVCRDVGADARSCVEGIESRRMTDDQVNVAVNPPVFVFAHLVGENAGGVVVLRIGSATGRTADVFPTFSSISAARHTALFDADQDFVRH